MKRPEPEEYGNNLLLWLDAYEKYIEHQRLEWDSRAAACRGANDAVRNELRQIEDRPSLLSIETYLAEIMHWVSLRNLHLGMWTDHTKDWTVQISRRSDFQDEEDDDIWVYTDRSLRKSLEEAWIQAKTRLAVLEQEANKLAQEHVDNGEVQ